MNLENLPVIDNHCHPFPTNRLPNETERMWSLSLNKLPLEDIRNMSFYQMSVEEMRRFHNLDTNLSQPEVIEKIKEIYLNDPEKYIEKLWEDINLKMIIADVGSPVTDIRLTKDELNEFDEINKSVKIGKVNRIERVTDDLLKEELSFDEFKIRFIENTNKMIADQELISLKSIIAYKTGLGIEPKNETEVRKGYYAYLADKTDESAAKIIRDYAFLMGAKVAADNDIPLQIHTGAGDSPLSNLTINNPLLMYEAINHEMCKNTKIVMVHAGYPNVEYAAYLVGQYENMYLDVSSMCPYAGHAVDGKLRAIFEIAPFNKVLYGSDGSGMPDFIWFGAKYFKRVLGKTLQNLIDDNVITEEYAMKAAKMVLTENAKKVYKLDI